jgi:hypothetical protein
VTIRWALMPDVDPCGMPIATDTRCHLPGDHDGPCQPEAPRCPACNHPTDTTGHRTDRRGNAVCWFPVCGCTHKEPGK